MKPKETVYAGCRFRSRLEARWAVFFDVLGIKWEYEKEGFDLDDGTGYLPDFFLHARGLPHMRAKYPGAGYWVEIKGKAPDTHEVRKLQEVSIYTKHHGCIAYGCPGDNPIVTVSNRPPLSKEDQEKQDQTMAAVFALLKYSPPSDIGIYNSQIVQCCSPYAHTRNAVDIAIKCAKSARFEFGESGVVLEARAPKGGEFSDTCPRCESKFMYVMPQRGYATCSICDSSFDICDDGIYQIQEVADAY